MCVYTHTCTHIQRNLQCAKKMIFEISCVMSVYVCVCIHTCSHARRTPDSACSHHVIYTHLFSHIFHHFEHCFNLCGHNFAAALFHVYSFLLKNIASVLTHFRNCSISCVYISFDRLCIPQDFRYNTTEAGLSGCI